MQLKPEVKAHYELLRQAVVPYGENVEQIDTNSAIKKYQPDNVIATWVTHKYNAAEHWRGGNQLGVDEFDLLSNIKKYIFIGNRKVHHTKPLLDVKHRTISEPWVLSRSLHQADNFIAIWENNN